MIATVTRHHQVPCVSEDLSAFCCQNLGCPDYGKKGIGNLRVDSHYGKSKSLRLLYCKSCRTRFSERKGSTLFGSQLDATTVALLYQHLEAGRGIRETARLLDVNRNTVVRYSRLRRSQGADGQPPA